MTDCFEIRNNIHGGKSPLKTRFLAVLKNCFDFRTIAKLRKCEVNLTSRQAADGIIATTGYSAVFWPEDIMALRFLLPKRISSPAAKRARKGVTAVEMALIAPAFFFMLIGITEIALICTAQQLLENAAFNTSRLAKTGYSANGQTQTQTVTQILTNELKSYGTLIDTSKVTMTTEAYSDFANAGNNTGGTNGLGTQDQIVVYDISYPWKLFTPMMSKVIGMDGYLNLTTHIVVHNEPFG
jgi:Flp pilus assembly protein TadG